MRRRGTMQEVEEKLVRFAILNTNNECKKQNEKRREKHDITENKRLWNVFRTSEEILTPLMMKDDSSLPGRILGPKIQTMTVIKTRRKYHALFSLSFLQHTFPARLPFFLEKQDCKNNNKKDIVSLLSRVDRMQQKEMHCMEIF